MSSPYRPAFESAQWYKKKKTPEMRPRKSGGGNQNRQKEEISPEFELDAADLAGVDEMDLTLMAELQGEVGETFSWEEEEDDAISETVSAIAESVMRRQADGRRKFMEEWHQMVFVVGVFAQAEEGEQRNGEVSETERVSPAPARQGNTQKRPSLERRPRFESLESRSLLSGGELFSVLPHVDALPKSQDVAARWISGGSAMERDAVGKNHLENHGVTAGRGQFGTGADFERDEGDYFSIADSAQEGLDFQDGDFSFSFWFKVEDEQNGTDVRSIVYKWGGVGDWSYALYHIQEGGVRQFELIVNSTGGRGGDGVARLPFTMPVGEWFQALVTHKGQNGGETVLHINGEETARASTGKTSIHNGGAEFRLGSHGTGGSHFDGYMEDVIAWKTALTGENAATLYAAYRQQIVGPLLPPPTDPVPPPPDETGGGNIDPTPEASAIPTEGLLLNLPIPKNLERTEALKLGSAFTISFWANADRLYDSGEMLSAGMQDKNLTFVTGADGGFIFGIGAGERGGRWGKIIEAPAGTLKAGTWQHITGTYDGGKIGLFVDETSIGSAENPAMDPGELPLNIGFRNADDGIHYPYEGELAGLLEYDRASHTAEQMKMIVHATDPRNRVVEEPPVIPIEGPLPPPIDGGNPIIDIAECEASAEVIISENQLLGSWTPGLMDGSGEGIIRMEDVDWFA